MFEMKNIQGEEKDMTLLAYQVFLAVVEQESFQKAAQVLNLTPSAISHAVASILRMCRTVRSISSRRWHRLVVWKRVLLGSVPSTVPA